MGIQFESEGSKGSGLVTHVTFVTSVTSSRLPAPAQYPTKLPIRPDRVPLARLEQNDDAWMLGTLGIDKHQPVYSDGWGHGLHPESRFYKRWFEFPDIGARGWAIILRIWDPVGEPTGRYETFPGWVPPERAAEADAWIAFLNDQIKARFREAADRAAAKAKEPPR